MWQPSERVRLFSRKTSMPQGVDHRYALANHSVDNRLDKLDKLVPAFPEVYLQLVFHYFQDMVQNPPPEIIQAEEPFYPLLRYEMIAYLATFLCDFGWLPARYVELPYRPEQYVNQADYAAVYRDRRNFRWMWELYLENPFYRTNIRARRLDKEVTLPGGQPYLHLIGDTPSHIKEGMTKKAFSTHGPMRELLRNCFIQYVVWLKETRLHEEYDYIAPGPLEVNLVYKTRISFAVTLFDHFKEQIDRINDMMKRLSPRMTELAEQSLQLLNANAVHRNQYLIKAYDVLRQSDRFVGLSQDATGHTYLFYLKRIKVLQDVDGWYWNCGHSGLYGEADRQYADSVWYDSLLTDSSELLQSLNLLPPIEEWTNGTLIEMLVEYLANDEAIHEANRRFIIKSQMIKGAITPIFYDNPFDVRNQVIWFVSVVPEWWTYLLSQLDQQTRARLGVPDNFEYMPYLV